jgi:hypothetical protein
MQAHKTPEGILLFVASAALLLAVFWAGWHDARPILPALAQSSNKPSPRVYQSAAFATPVAEVQEWVEPAPQKSGRSWLFEVFTPPAIYYDSVQGGFTVIDPTVEDDASSDDTPKESAGSRSEPFRLQLVGFVGGEGSYFGAFENLRTTEHFLARGGRQVPGLDVTILDFGVQRETIGSVDSMPVVELVAVAVVRDEQTGERITLTNRERRFGDARPEVAAEELRPSAFSPTEAMTIAPHP